MPPTDRQARNLIDLARKGYPLRVCARIARVHPVELAAWVDAGDKEGADGAALLFTQQWHEAHALFIAGQHDEVATSVQSGKDSPNCMARLWLLERLHPDIYGRRPVESEAPPAPSNVPAAVAELDPETRAEVKAALDRRRQRAGEKHL